MNPIEPPDAFFDARRADLYFLNTQKVLVAEGMDPRVTMEVFANGSGVLCGIRETVAALVKALPEGCRIEAMDEGGPIERKLVVLRISGPYRAFGIYETALLGILSHGTGWATAARRCVEAAAGKPVVSFGARHVHPAVSDRMEYAALVGGCTGCATAAGAEHAGQEPTGTMPHAMMLLFGDTVSGARAFNAHMDERVRRIVLVDTFRDEAEESVRVAEALAGDLWGVRLDTPSELGGVTVALAARVRSALDEAGHGAVKILVSGGFGPEKIRQFIEEDAPVDGFGVGSAISGAPPIDFTADLKEIDGRPVAKRGREPGITENPALKRVL